MWVSLLFSLLFLVLVFALQAHLPKKNKQRLAVWAAEGDRRRQAYTWVAGRPCQSHRAEETRDLMGRGWFMLLIRGIAEYVVSLCFPRVNTMRGAAACLTVLEQLSFYLLGEVTMHETTNIPYTHRDLFFYRGQNTSSGLCGRHRFSRYSVFFWG